ncbi:Cys-tRNA(Pro) deacylase [Natronospirillum operosum]|uniref:Cys-tRNA(Pro)/Cys-tRNA(Cys) deacylase n=1 Tax=Natronospirillum operosum TaxID=2759953 RepID=A0A4Z0W9T5_9GAMM|nr:Cys-tRNA(Pro) deacylase [Natronospirillum operosum]TGG93939.1 Cys-tRNA(Pro) deacylase [Natronospirillum operosum]
MTPAVRMVEAARVPFRVHEYTHDAGAGTYGQEAADKLGLPAEQVFKTLVVQLDSGRLAVALVPVTAQLNLKNLARATGAKKAAMAAPVDVQRATGYVLGGVSPLGQKKRLATWIDQSALEHEVIYVSAGRRGLELELATADLQRLTAGQFAPLI